MRSAAARPSALAWNCSRQSAQRHVQLGGQQQHGERGAQGHRAVDQAQPESHRDEGSGQRGGEIEHRARDEGDAQCLHRGAAVLVADRRDALRLDLAAVEGAQRGEPAHDVEKVVRQARQRLPAGARAPFGVAADQPHEQRDQRQRHGHDQGRGQVDGHGPGEHRQGHQHRQHELGEIAGEVGLEGVDALDGGGGDLAGLGAVGRRRGVAQPPLARARGAAAT